jgi:hypothetical protein
LKPRKQGEKEKFKWRVQHVKWKPVPTIGLALIFLIIGLPYLLAGIHIGPELLNDALLGQCPTRAHSRGLACNLPPYADTTLAGFGFFMTAGGFAIALSIFGRRCEEISKVIGCIAYFGLMYAAIPVIFRGGGKNGFSMTFAGLALCFSVLYITMFSYLWLRHNEASKE